MKCGLTTKIYRDLFNFVGVLREFGDWSVARRHVEEELEEEEEGPDGLKVVPILNCPFLWHEKLCFADVR